MLIPPILRLDTIGLVGFSHDFGALTGQRSMLGELFDAIAIAPISLLGMVVMLLAPVIPALAFVPTPRATLLQRFNVQSGVLADALLAKTVQAEGTIQKDDRSILGLLSACAVDTDRWKAEQRCDSPGADCADGLPDVREGGKLPGEEQTAVIGISSKRFV
jgi:hypothetical protein